MGNLSNRKLPELIECDKYCIIIINERLIRETDKIVSPEFTVQKFFHGGVGYGLVSYNVYTCSTPAFTSLSELQSGRKSPHIIFKGITNSFTKELLLGVQLERTSSGDMYSGQYFGFSSSDNIFLSLLCTSLSSKLDSISTAISLKETIAQSYQLPSSLCELLRARSISELLSAVYYSLPKATGFEHAEALFFDPKSKELCKGTIDESTGKVTKMYKFSADTGIAGSAFSENRAIFGSYGKAQYTFQEIDRVVMCGGVYNYAFLPLYGYATETVGVVKLINKKDGLVSSAEVDKLKPYQKAIGLMIKHIQELDNTLSASISIKRLLNCIDKTEKLQADVFMLNFHGF